MIKDLRSRLTIFFSAGFIFFIHSLNAQSWTEEASFPGGGRQYCSYFTIGTKGYVGFGNNQAVNDLWEYDPGTNTWTQKASIPEPGGRAEMISFSIGDYGYVGLGLDSISGTSSEFWQYSQASNTWIEVAPYPGSWTRGSIAFSIGTNAYVGSGSVYAEFYEYNSLTNTWTQKSDLPTGAQRYFGVGFAIGGKGYIGTGVVGSTAQDDFWEYDPTSDTWTQKANVGGGIRVNAVGFSNSTNGFIGMGGNNLGSSYDDLWEYAPATDTWTQQTNYAGAGRVAGACFAIGCNFYMGLGFNNSYVDEADFWGLPVCTYLPLTATVSQTGDSCYGGNNGTATANPSGGTPPYSYIWQPGNQTTQTISGLAAGTYTVVVTDSVHDTYADSAIITQPPPLSIGISADTSICSGSPVRLTATGGSAYTWSPTTGLDSTGGATVMATPVSSTTYTVTATVSGCSGEDSVSISIIPPSHAGTITAEKDTICAGSYDNLSLTGDSGNILWQSSEDGITFATIPGTDSSGYLTQPMQSTYYMVYTTGVSCPDTSLPFKLVVNALPFAPTLTTNDSLLCSGDSTQICTASTFASYLWNTGDTTYCTIVNQANGYWVTVTDANGCSTVSGHQNISFYPIPSVSIIEEGDTLSSFNSNYYQWYSNDTIIPGANSSVYVAHQSGNYAVQIVDSNGCYELSNYTDVSITGIETLSDINSISIYPNPASAQLSIESNEPLSEIRIMDILGREVKNQPIRLSGIATTQINISELPAGTYEVLFYNGKQFLGSQLLVHEIRRGNN